MLSVKKCRELIPGHEEYTDEQIVSIRDDLQILAEIALESYFEDVKMGRIPQRDTEEK